MLLFEYKISTNVGFLSTNIKNTAKSTNRVFWVVYALLKVVGLFSIVDLLFPLHFCSTQLLKQWKPKKSTS